MAVRDAIDLVCLLDDLRMEGGHDELAGVPLICRLRSHTAFTYSYEPKPRPGKVRNLLPSANESYGLTRHGIHSHCSQHLGALIV